MSNSNGISSQSQSHDHFHVAMITSSGMGHLLPAIRVAASLIHHKCSVTLINSYPIVSSAESKLISNFLSAFPQVTEKKFTPIPIDPMTTNVTEPFLLQWETINRSAHLLSPIISSLSPPPSFVVTDVTLMSSVVPVTSNLRLPNYMLFISSVRMFSLFSNFPCIPSSIHEASIPKVLLDPNHGFSKNFSDNSRSLKHVDGVLINSFEGLEKEVVTSDGLPPVFALGPLLPLELEGKSSLTVLKWLEEQKERSVLYVGFGNVTKMSKEQIRELGNGLILSGYKFLWVVKTKVVDKEEKDDLEEILGDELMNKIESNGLVVKEWVTQWEILSCKGVGGFLSHCGWNSTVEAALCGVPVLAWPQNGDQMINAEVIEASGFGVCAKNWGWGLDRLVKGEEIGEKIKEVMGTQLIKLKAARIGEAAKQSLRVGGSCENVLKELFQSLKKK